MWTGALKISQDVLKDYYVTQPYLEKGFSLLTKAVEQEPVSDIIPLVFALPGSSICVVYPECTNMAMTSSRKLITGLVCFRRSAGTCSVDTLVYHNASCNLCADGDGRL
jgi:hypothetical protein